MSIFERLGRSTAEPELSDELRKRLADLDERMRLQERGLKALELDWQEWFDKFRLMYARLTKRIKDAAQAEPDAPESSQDAPRTTNPRAVAYDRPYQPPKGPNGARRHY